MTVPTISNLPTVPATSDPNFETEAPALFNHIKNTFVSEMNSAISFINSSTFDATVEFKNSNFTAARNFLYMIDTSSGGVSVTLPANPSTGDQLLLMDQKRTFATNNLTIGRNSQNINGSASDVVSKSTGALIRCIFQSSYGWTVDLYEGQWESGTSAGDLVYNGGNVGIGTSAPGSLFDVQGVASSLNAPIGAFVNNYDNVTNGTSSYAVMRLGRVGSDGVTYGNSVDFGVSRYESSGTNSRTRLDISLAHTTASTDTNVMTLRSDGNVGIGINNPRAKLSLGIGGTAAAPAFILSNDQDTGFYRPAENALGFTTTGVSRMVIDSSGNVGIGTSAPNQKLDIITGETQSSCFHIGERVNEGAYFSSTTDNALQIWAGAQLDSNAIRARATAASGITLNNGLVVFYTDDTLTDGATYTQSERMRITSDGNVGIGTSSPGAKLDVNGTSRVYGGNGLFVSGELAGSSPFLAGGALELGTTSTAATIQAFHRILNPPSFPAYDLIFKTQTNTRMFTNSVERLTIDSSGNVGIGTSAPSEKFYVATGEAHVDYASTPPLKGSALRLATNTTSSFICSNQYFGTDGTGGGGNGIRRARNGGCGNIAFDTTSGSTAGDIKFETSPNSTQYALATLTERMRIKQAGDVEVSTGNLVIGTAGKGIDFGVASGSVTSQLLDDYEEGTFTPAFIDTNGDASFTHDIQQGRYTKVGDCVYFSLTIGTDSVTAGTGDLKISGLPFTAQNAESQIKPSGAVGINYSWGTSPTHWLVNANSDAVILYKSVNPLTASKSADCGTTADDNRLFMHGFYFV